MAPQGPDSAPGPSMATHVPPPLGPSLHDVPSDDDYVCTRGTIDDWEHVRLGFAMCRLLDPYTPGGEPIHK